MAVATLPNKTGIYQGPYLTSDTYANIVANYSSAPFVNFQAYATDLKAVVTYDGSQWRFFEAGYKWAGYDGTWRILFGGSGDTYSQSGTTITVTTANGVPGAQYNGAYVYLNPSSGAALPGWFTNYTYVNSTTYTVTSSVSQTTSGNIGANLAETFLNYTGVVPGALLHSGDAFFLQPFRVGKATANVKTTKIYMNNNVDTSSNIGSSGAVSIMTTGAWCMINSTQCILSGNTAGPFTASNPTYTISNTFGTNTEWAAYMPDAISIAVKS